MNYKMIVQLMETRKWTMIQPVEMLANRLQFPQMSSLENVG